MDVKQLRSEFEQRGIRRVKIGGFDLDGVLRGKYISADKLWSAVESGLGFCDVIFGWDIADVLYDNTSVTGWHSGYPDIQAHVDLETFRVLPTEPATAHFLVDFYLPDGSPHPACPRNLLKRVLARLASAGMRARIGVEYEYWMFRETPQSLQDKGYSQLTPLTPGMFGYSWVRQGQHAGLIEEWLDALNAYDIVIEGMHTETGPGVYEAAIRYQDALRAADMAALFKPVMKVLCSRHGLIPTFMAKWNSELPGSSGHIHQSLWDADGEVNLFADPTQADGLSTRARHYVAGMVQLMPELTALYAPTLNSYKRFVPGLWAPMTASWGHENRTCAVRAITGPSREATRLELRQTAADINPYIAIATSLAAGMYGMEQALECPAPATGDATQAHGRPIPHTMQAAITALSQSQIAPALLGETFVNHYVRTREWELRQAARAVTDWELARYFEAI